MSQALEKSNAKAKGEEILRSSQCLVNTCGVILVWYDYNISPSILLSLAQLYGGQYKDFLSEYNTDVICQGMCDTDVNRAKTTIKILKRVVGTDPVLLKKASGEVKDQLIKALQGVKTSQPTLVQLADEVLKSIEADS